MKKPISPRRQKKVTNSNDLNLNALDCVSESAVSAISAADLNKEQYIQDLKNNVDSILQVSQGLKAEITYLYQEVIDLKKIIIDLNPLINQKDINTSTLMKQVSEDVIQSRTAIVDTFKQEISQLLQNLNKLGDKKDSNTSLMIKQISDEMSQNWATSSDLFKQEISKLVINLNQIIDQKDSNTLALIKQVSNEISENRAKISELLKKEIGKLVIDLHHLVDKKDLNTSALIKQVTDELTQHKIQISNLFRQEINKFTSSFTDDKQERDLERTISFQIGKTLIESKKSIETLVNLPNKILQLKNEAKSRTQKLKNINIKETKNVEMKTALPLPSNTVKSVKEDRSALENKNTVKEINISEIYPQISYDFIKKHWPSTSSKARFISIFDEISENSWCNKFKLYPLNKNNYPSQIQNSTSNALFVESCWKGNGSTWEYAFTSPGLKHANAQKLLDALSIAKQRSLPIIFWNKEDPMHYDKFLPIAEKCDIIFTTDSNRVPDYKRDLPGKKVYPLVFAANPFICNPINRNRYEQETICFAGSYYSVGHDDRKIQMDQLLPALLEFNGAIYDRMSKLDNERYFFPEQYRHLIRDAVDFKTMSVLYKRFKIFLNVNTITDSPTMMSRRVYELLACGTPVISTPSLALETQFPGIVQIAKNAEEAVKIAKDLLQDEWKYKHLAHRGYREVMQKHTYNSRVKEILSSIDINYDDSPAKVSILMATMRENYIDRILENLGRQNYSNLELFLITQGFSKAGVQKLSEGIEKISNIKHFKILEINETLSLGERLNKAASFATGEYLAKMDDDDFYFDNYLTDMVLPFKYGNFGLVGKKEIFVYLEGSNKTVIRYANQSHRITDFVAGPTLVIKRKIFDQVGGFNALNRGEDSTLIEKIKELKLPVYSSDAFNFIQWRSKDSQNHTWQVGDELFLKDAEVFEGFDTSKVII